MVNLLINWIDENNQLKNNREQIIHHFESLKQRTGIIY